MRITWRQRLEQNPEMRNIDSWPAIDVNTIKKENRTSFILNKRIVACVIKEGKVTSVANKFDVNRATINRLMARTLGGSSDESPALTKGLIPYYRLTTPVRKSALDTLYYKANHQHAFRFLLDEIPDMRDGLDEMIIAALKDKPNSQVTSCASFYGEFKRRLVEANWPTDTYPYTTSTFARESVRRYYHERLDILRLLQIKTPKREIRPRATI